jgi:hypothetical protein
MRADVAHGNGLEGLGHEPRLSPRPASFNGLGLPLRRKSLERQRRGDRMRPAAKQASRRAIFVNRGRAGSVAGFFARHQFVTLGPIVFGA